ncbi:protein TPX2 [Nymphaea colorata]|nr:protein TPX2 [Nymphaea colorata]
MMEASSEVECLHPLQIDEIYEFSAPRFFDFIVGETEEEIRAAQQWFEVTRSYAPSPFMLRIKTSRKVDMDSTCNFQETEELLPAKMATETREANLPKSDSRIPEEKLTESETVGKVGDGRRAETRENQLAASESSAQPGRILQNADSSTIEKSATKKPIKPTDEIGAGTPKAQIMSSKNGHVHSCKNPTAKMKLQKPSTATKLTKQTPMSQARTTKGSALRLPASALKNSANIDIKQENQAIKRQKLDGGRSRQILNVKERVLHHKSEAVASKEKAANGQATRTCREKRYELTVKKEINPFVSAAELVNKFHSRTRELEISQHRSLSHDDAASMTHRKPPLALTQPKEPEFLTARRVRPVKVKSSAELEEEMLANIPKFKARPVNKKILEARSLPVPSRSIPQPPEFHEFHLKTMERASQHAGTSYMEISQKGKSKPENTAAYGLTVPKSPHLETSTRSRPQTIKSSEELEQEELANMPKFKARPLNKKILVSKGELGVFRNQKHQATIPQEFHFATDERIPAVHPVVDLFDKLSINSDCRDKEIPRITIPNPFNLQTEERGLEKEKRFLAEVLHEQLEEQKARVPKASPYPYSTDYPVIPPKPQPKECTKPEAFQLVSLIRHEEEMQRLMQEKERMEKEVAEMRKFKAQPILDSDPIPVPEKRRIPLTQVQEFALHVDHRSVDRAEFDKKVKEKEAIYKRYREEYEAAKAMEEEKATKQMRRMMVPHARPVPSFANPFVPERSSKEITKPKSPCLLIAQRKQRAAASGFAHMR